MTDLKEQLLLFKPFNKQEAADQKIILSILDDVTLEPFSRSAITHFTASAWTLDQSLKNTLMVYHNIYQSWSWIGGHADGVTDLKKVALVELEEETAVADGAIIKIDKSTIFSIEVLPVQGHFKNQEYVTPHIHLNITYLVQASNEVILKVNTAENSAVSWV